MAPPSTPNSFPPSEAFDEIVEVRVGPGHDAKSYRFHKGLLAFYSGYFSGALNGSFTESKTGVLTMPTEDPSTFSNFQYWLYTCRFHHTKSEETQSLPWNMICRLWVFGDAHEIPLLQNAAINVLRKKMVDEWIVPKNQVQYVYNKTTSSAKLRKFLIEAIANSKGPKPAVSKDIEDGFTKEALMDLLRFV